MGSFSHQSFSQSSPVLAMTPQLPPQPSFNRPSFTSPFVKAPLSSTPQSSWLTPTSAPQSAAGRKRSRDEADFEDEEYFSQAPVEPVIAENEDEWEYGPGMTLIKPSKGYILSADSQTGTWLEEEEAEKKAQAALRAASPERPILRSAKSQRIDLGSTPSMTEETKVTSSVLSTPLQAGGIGPVQPSIDEYTRHLGIGWSKISADEDIQAAVRGWTKYIENHYPVNNAIIRLQSRGLASYLVEAQEGYFLFGDDLKQGRLVSTSLEKTFENLRGPVPIFEGDMVIEASETPKASSPVINAMTNAHVEEMMMTDENSTTDLPNHAVEVEMDMS
ncbi:hypothetical protein SS1G_05881 [Sclerotinia sclerotiorum 1980 UF-70]|uniref:Uncharacterized protein n=2 Tax=Sclerotinia sclerotiorum (strain ATCC 18683 / 1980 / Ss-1) TaxID=665079 RepID=A7EKN4_SCLS1|nr:hypothetical protein SS1G_05881 [Sclerotinia sclerotiorum 1980 UF-70]APA09881.1 hypothetical protein sscle_05g046510 [Sclerotinia sclerotiorum 1980 UF-70]EDO03400.1 hypothetical protein SS1G_05881 [Sclerotinia sclerotiorum 1980 UF-70]